MYEDDVYYNIFFTGKNIVVTVIKYNKFTTNNMTKTLDQRVYWKYFPLFFNKHVIISIQYQVVVYSKCKQYKQDWKLKTKGSNTVYTI